jgi:hypothetical protein
MAEALRRLRELLGLAQAYLTQHLAVMPATRLIADVIEVSIPLEVEVFNITVLK